MDHHWPPNEGPRPDDIRLRILVRGVVRHVSWVDRTRLATAIGTIRTVFNKTCPDVPYTLVAEYDNVSVLIVRT